MTDPVQRGRGEAPAGLLMALASYTIHRAECVQEHLLDDGCCCGLKELLEAAASLPSVPAVAVGKHTQQCLEIALMLGGAGFPEDIPIQDAVRQLIQDRAAASGRPHPEALDALVSKWRDNYGWDNSARSAYQQAADELKKVVAALPSASASGTLSFMVRCEMCGHKPCDCTERRAEQPYRDVASVETLDLEPAKARIRRLKTEGFAHLASVAASDEKIAPHWHVDGPDVECPHCDDIFGEADILQSLVTEIERLRAGHGGVAPRSSSVISEKRNPLPREMGVSDD